MSQENVELAHRLVEWFNAGDAEALQAHSTEDVEIVPLRAEIEDTVYRGRERLRPLRPTARRAGRSFDSTPRRFVTRATGS